MLGWFAFAAGLLLPFMFWICRWQDWPFWYCGLILLPLAWPRRQRVGVGTKASLADLMPKGMKWLLGLLAAALGVAALVFRNAVSLQYYSVVVSVFFLSVFASSLTHKQSLIERLARQFEPNLPESGVRYTRRVTQAWCVFFLLNTALTLWSIHAGEKVWALYNGFISYVLMGCMFAGEWLVRRRVKRRNNSVVLPGFRETPHV
jgi:uncharacterized membrane protein